MFSLEHLIWLAICVVLIAVSLFFAFKKNLSLKTVLTFCVVIAVLSEIIKVGAAIQMVPTKDGSSFHPYLETNYLPIHLCSIQIFLIFIARFAKESNFKKKMLAFMYPTCIVGSLFALAFPSTFSRESAFTDPVIYQTFIYHSMLIVLGVYIFKDRYKEFTSKDMWSSILILLAAGVISIYVNSIFSIPYYENGELISVDHWTNFFFTYKPPIDIKLTEVWHWYLWILIEIGLVFILIPAAFSPILVREYKAKKGTTREVA